MSYYGFKVWYSDDDVVLDNESMVDPTDFLIKLRILNTVQLRCPPHLLQREGEGEGEGEGKEQGPVFYGESIPLDPIEDSFRVPCNELVSEDYNTRNAEKFLTAILSQIGIPNRMRYTMADDFSCFARWMRCDGRFCRCSVLPMIVEIKITSVLQCNEITPDTWDLVPYEQVPASASEFDSSVENLGLGRVRLVNGPEECVICLETIPAWSFVTAMPCFHVYHKTCIVKWLETSDWCPMSYYGFKVWYSDDDVVFDNESMLDPTDFLIKLRIINTVELGCPPCLLQREGEEQGSATVPVYYGESIPLDPIEDSFRVLCNEWISEDYNMRNAEIFLTPILSEIGIPARRQLLLLRQVDEMRWSFHSLFGAAHDRGNQDYYSASVQ